MSTRTRPLVLLALVPLLLAVGCTKDVDESSTPVKIGPDAETVSVDLTSTGSTLYEVGPDGERTYGQNVLRGPATVDGRPATVEVLGNVEYVDGSGPFYGFLTVKWADGSSLGFNLQGTAVKGDGGATSLTADLRFIGGSGRLAEAQAAARFTGTRDGKVGAPVKIRLTIDIVEPAA